MPVFDSENFVGKIISMKAKEGDFGPQIEGEIERLDEGADRMVWIPIPTSREGKPSAIHKNTTLARWVSAVAEVEPEVDELDFRHRDKAIQRLCEILQGNCYLWENRNYPYAQGSKDRLTPVQKFSNEAAARAAIEGISLPPEGAMVYSKAEEALVKILLGGGKWDVAAPDVFRDPAILGEPIMLTNLVDDTKRIGYLERLGLVVDSDGLYRKK